MSRFLPIPLSRSRNVLVVVHELTHTRQVLLLKAHGWPQPRGAHRDKGWFTAVSEAAPNYLSVELPASVWPTGSRTRKETLTEVEMAHWPRSIRRLIEQQDGHQSSAAERTSSGAGL